LGVVGAACIDFSCVKIQTCAFGCMVWSQTCTTKKGLQTLWSKNWKCNNTCRVDAENLNFPCCNSLYAIFVAWNWLNL